MREVRGPDPQSFADKILTKAEADYAHRLIRYRCPRLRLRRRRCLQAAEAADPNLAGPHEELGFLAWRAGHDGEAGTNGRKPSPPIRPPTDPPSLSSCPALRSNSKRRSSSSRPSMLSKPSTPEAPKFAPAFVELALIDGARARSNAAYKTSVAAEKLEPWRAEYHLLTGHILLQGHQPAARRQDARQVADRWPGSDHDEAVDLWNQVPASRSRRRPSPHSLSAPRRHRRARHHPQHQLQQAIGLTVVLQPTDPSRQAPESHRHRPL